MVFVTQFTNERTDSLILFTVSKNKQDTASKIQPPGFEQAEQNRQDDNWLQVLGH